MPRKKAKAHRNNGLRYTDEQKAIAVATVRASGGAVTDQSLADVRLVLNSPTLSLSTLDAWLRNAHYEPSETDFDSTSRNRTASGPRFDPNAAAIEQWRQTRINYLKRANEPSAVVWTEGKDAVAAAERAQKMEQLLSGLPTEIIGILPDLLAAMERRGLNASDVFNTMLARLNAKAVQDAPDLIHD